MALTKTRLTAAIALAAWLCPAGIASAQDYADQAANAADAAVEAAADVEDAIRAIDPTTGEASTVVDPSLPEPYGPPAPSPEEVAETGRVQIGAQAVAGPSFDEVTYNTVPSPEVQAAPRGPAARMISQPQVQAIPEPAVAQAQPSDDPFTIKSILPIEGTIRYGEWYWDESNAPTSGKLIVTVDLEARVISVFRDGHEIGTAVALLGTDRHPTPLGTFPILTKEKDNVSEKYNNAPMPWTLRLTWDGIAIHGSPVANGYASHGCIGVPDEFAERLFDIAKRGDKVVITRGRFINVGDAILS